MIYYNLKKFANVQKFEYGPIAAFRKKVIFAAS